MTKALFGIGVLPLIGAVALCAPAAKFPAVYPPQNDVSIDHLVKIHMRDGVIL